MDIYLQKPKTLNIKYLGIIFFVIALLLFFIQNFLFSEEQNLEESINDELVWQEVKNLSIPLESLEKLISEIEGIKRKVRKGDPCEQYVLKASIAGFYECSHSSNKKIYLNVGEIWKIGKTCLEENGRYAQGLPDRRLKYFEEFRGTAMQCLIMEKVKLYAYELSPENQNRNKPLKLPPGNKIFR